jgi:hypothetical protein
MVTGSKLTAVLSLLIAAVQFAGVGAVTSSSTSRASAEYYCCCPGECHCTADCCHHAPPGLKEGTSDIPRIGGGSPILEAPRSCGTWTGTLNRAPQSPKALPAARQRSAARQPDDGFRRLPHSSSVFSTQETFQASAPRGPPVSVNVA